MSRFLWDDSFSVQFYVFVSTKIMLGKPIQSAARKDFFWFDPDKILSMMMNYIKFNQNL